MEQQEILTQLSARFRGKIKINEPMSLHTSFHIGGPADLLAIPSDREDIRTVLGFVRDNRIPLTVLGNGSNVLVRDKGIRGIVLKLGNALKEWSGADGSFTFGSGIALAQCSRIVGEAGYTGMEFAVGIPGSLGGALYMNAGAYGGEMKDTVVSAEILFPDGTLRICSKEELDLSYRHSALQGNGGLALSITLRVAPAEREAILAKMNELSRRRSSKQPLEMPSAGSTFKRPVGRFVGPMIEEAGLKGFTIGGAQVSVKHAGFIVNTGNATAADVLQLIAHIQKRIYDGYQVSLQPEVMILGEE